jgi:hypothetical protein
MNNNDRKEQDMRRERLVLSAVAGLAAAFTAAVVFLVAIAPATATSSKTTFSVTSTLRDKKLVPRRIHWVARTSAPASEVRFLIDGKVRWIEHNPPFSYSDDGGYLVTSWLSPGRHRFAVHATSVTGARATEAVTARVPAAPPPPAGLAGRWQRVIPKPVPPDPAFPGDAVPAGTWTIVIDKRWIASHFPGKFNPATSPQTGAGNILLDDYTPGPQAFTVYGAVTTGPLNISGATSSPQGGGWWCGPGGPKAVYSWSASGDKLSLRPVGHDACSQRGGVFTGTWTRVG